MYPELILLLLIGHMLGDYYFQPEILAIMKELSFGVLFIHELLYLLAMILVILPFFSLELFIFIVLISALHYIVDICKYILIVDGEYDNKMLAIDQLLHLISIFLILYFMKHLGIVINFSNFFPASLHANFTNNLKICFFILLLMKPASVFISQVLYRFVPRRLSYTNSKIEKAGSLIGISERLLILVFLSYDQFILIGVLIISKSMIRFNKAGEGSKFSDYYLLGTFLSVLIAIVSFYILKGI